MPSFDIVIQHITIETVVVRMDNKPNYDEDCVRELLEDDPPSFDCAVKSFDTKITIIER